MFQDDDLLKQIKSSGKKKSYSDLINKTDLSDYEMDDLFLDY